MAGRLRQLTDRQAAFVAEYLVDLNSVAAAERAGFKNPTVLGPRYRNTPHIAAAIDEALAVRVARIEVKSDEVLRELQRLLNADIGDLVGEDGKFLSLKKMPVDARRVLAGVEFDVLGNVVKVRMPDKNRATELAMKHVGLFKPTEHKHEVKVTLEQLVPKRPAGPR